MAHFIALTNRFNGFILNRSWHPYGQDPDWSVIAIQTTLADKVFWVCFSEIQLIQVSQSGPDKMMVQPGIFAFNNTKLNMLGLLEEYVK